MQGSVSLHEHGYSCRFTGGRLAGTSIGTGMFADIQTAAPWISRDGHEYPFKIENAYSFESGNTYGLKTSFEFSEEFTLQPGTLTVDYVFIEDLSWLIINIDVRYPVFEPGTVIDGYAPFEVPVFACVEEDGIEVIEHYPDGESAAFKLTPAAGECSISGKGFTFRKGANVVSLWLPDAEGETIETLTAVFKRRKKAYAFCIQPRGENTDVRTEELSGLEESFCLALIPVKKAFHTLS